MRADRLISMLILLQTRGVMTAQALAHALEVSERTIYRDIQALGIAGVPIYAERGPGGGVSLLEGYRTTLTGLTESEVRALFMFSIPQPLNDLGLGGDLQAARLKLAAALPPGRSRAEERTRQCLHLDTLPWAQSETTPTHLQALYGAVWDARRLKLVYRMFLGAPVTAAADPYGLVSKAGVWHLVYASQGRLRRINLAHIIAIELTDESFERPSGFDLAETWQKMVAGAEQERLSYPVTVRVAPGLAPDHHYYFGDGARSVIVQASPPDDAGEITLELHFESLEAARARLLELGGAVEVLAPLALRLSMEDFARQALARYAPFP